MIVFWFILLIGGLILTTVNFLHIWEDYVIYEVVPDSTDIVFMMVGLTIVITSLMNIFIN